MVHVPGRIEHARWFSGTGTSQSDSTRRSAETSTEPSSRRYGRSTRSAVRGVDSGILVGKSCIGREVDFQVNFEGGRCAVPGVDSVGVLYASAGVGSAVVLGVTTGETIGRVGVLVGGKRCGRPGGGGTDGFAPAGGGTAVAVDFSGTRLSAFFVFLFLRRPRSLVLVLDLESAGTGGGTFGESERVAGNFVK